MRLKAVVIAFIALFVNGFAVAQEQSVVVDGRDTIYYNYTPIMPVTESKRANLNFTVVPLYTPATSFAIGTSVQSYYTTKNKRLDRSLFSAVVVASIRGMYSVAVSNINPFCVGKHHLTTSISASSMPSKFWGIGYLSATKNSAINYTNQRYSAMAEYLNRVAKRVYIGMRIEADYNYCSKGFEDISTLLYPQAMQELFATTISAIIKYDSRDSGVNPQKGLYLSLRSYLRPKWFSSAQYHSFGLESAVSAYHRLWKGAVVAEELYTELNSQNTPWQLYAQIGDSHRMRGYYEGQFIDRNITILQIELRQDIWRGIGIAAWGGAGNCFDSFVNYKWSHILPNYGVGLRWLASKGVLLRLDYGFGLRVGGKLINGALFSLGSAF